MTEYTEFWEQWVGSTARPVERIKPRARVTKRDGRNWITYRDELDGKKIIVEMPDNATTKSCDHGRHDHCVHRLGGPAEGRRPAQARPAGVPVALRMPLPPRSPPGRPLVLIPPNVRSGSLALLCGPGRTLMSSGDAAALARGAAALRSAKTAAPHHL